MKTFNFGKYKGLSIQRVAFTNPNYVKWAIENVAGFKELAKDIEIPETKIKNMASHNQYSESYDEKMPSDHGSEVTDDRGSVIGTRYYRRSSTGGDLECHTVYPNGSGVWHGGGMGGDLYYDEFGNT
jgi:hypothetical protein